MDTHAIIDEPRYTCRACGAVITADAGFGGHAQICAEFGKSLYDNLLIDEKPLGKYTKPELNSLAERCHAAGEAYLRRAKALREAASRR